jgi:Cyclin, N-terminal domain
MATTTDDVVLRAPLHGFGSSSKVDLRRFDDLVRPSISALLVGANVLQISVQARFTAAVLLHRYYHAIGIPPDDAASGTVPVDEYRAQHEEEKYVVAACLLLACKREEEHRRLRDLVNIVDMVDWKVLKEKDDGLNVLSANDDPSDDSRIVKGTGSESDRSHTTILWRNTPPDLDGAYWNAKQRLVKTEQRVLQYLAFDISVSRPHRAVVLLLQQTRTTIDFVTGNDLVWQSLARTTTFQGKDLKDGLSSRLLQSAMCVLNGLVYSSAVLRHAVLPLAVAAISLAASHMAQSAITMATASSQSQSSQSHHYDVSTLTAALELIATQWWVSLAPVSLDDAKAALVSFQRVQPDETDPLSPDVG